jgi:hypothetical protein
MPATILLAKKRPDIQKFVEKKNILDNLVLTISRGALYSSLSAEKLYRIFNTGYVNFKQFTPT